mmetsp:Transcript_22261/g.59473  ORF Transcript_22261/g.59473 Transcript_22261/m.59473 type:complete len:201 (+) Transcript_22261:209-811(+)
MGGGLPRRTSGGALPAPQPPPLPGGCEAPPPCAAGPCRLTDWITIGKLSSTKHKFRPCKTPRGLIPISFKKACWTPQPPQPPMSSSPAESAATPWRSLRRRKRSPRRCSTALAGRTRHMTSKRKVSKSFKILSLSVSCTPGKSSSSVVAQEVQYMSACCRCMRFSRSHASNRPGSASQETSACCPTSTSSVEKSPSLPRR